jgi:cytochrome c oxidase accessory protein FixG
MEHQNDDFRNSISTVDASGKRVWVYPQKPSGNYHKKRLLVSIFLIAVLFITPFLKFAGEPLFLFNVFERKFIIFGKIFLPQDFHLFALAMIIFFVFIILFTVAFGRIWCGWICPQTIFMEMLFRKIEYWIEGDAFQQKKLRSAPMNWDKIKKKGLKHLIFAAISTLIGNVLLAYIVGVDRLSELITHPPQENITLFIGVTSFSILFYFIFAEFREQACTIVCPYGRLQGVLMGKETINIIYDFIRGEPRGKIKNNKNADDAPKGDCVDCQLCVRVCPTGIDIRNGTQMECVGCTACIDACDQIMERVGRPKGLIRYASYDEVKSGEKFIFTTRMKAYTAVLCLLIAGLSFLLLQREKTETTVLRAKGTTFIRLENEAMRNMFSFQLANKTPQKMNVKMRLVSPVGKLEIAGGDFDVAAREVYSGAFVVDLERKNIKGMKTPIVIEVFSGNEVLETIEIVFSSPYIQ